MKKDSGRPAEPPTPEPQSPPLPTNLERVTRELEAARKEVDEQWIDLEKALTSDVHYPWFLRQQ